MQFHPTISFRVSLAASLAALAGVPAVGLAQLDAGDVGLTIDNGQIVTGLIAEDGEGDISDRRRVFIGEIGVREDEGDGDIFPAPAPGESIVPSTNTPGFDSAPGTFPTSQSLGLDVLSTTLLLDNSSPVVRYDPDTDSLVATSVDVQASFTSSNITRTTGETTATDSAGVLFLPVFDQGEGDGSGRWHRHYNFALFDGINPANGNLISPADGVYVLEADIDYTGTEFAGTDPFFFVFGVNRPDTEVQAAVDFLNNNVVPEPTGLAALSLGGLALLRRRRR